MELIAEEIIHEVIPGILEKDWGEIEKKLRNATSFAKAVHVDILDGKFAQNSTFIDPKPFSQFSDELFLEVHMMVDNPIEYLKPFANAGFKRFIGHVEKMPNINEFIAEAQLYGEVALGIDADTKIDTLDINFDDVDALTVMMIKAGFSGQIFREDLVEKVKTLRSKTQLPIEVDGGIKDTTLLFAKHAGANRFVATSFIWNAQDPKTAFDNLSKIAVS